ncbi:tyrosine-type recombinase/integrase [Entomomonas sp. E2T0]|uniref:tyrosine-type recombinase/integrase n=1 Tax=Entomomonas sp. E2T0 TaxID=2930213 RepID=UPI0022284319|nr:integrase arm-type DNA-binding domain-containing protein [Entomomonas sp. E2T0]UYZ84338.1 tyrosine-type recombinase/integrase [Entomomonas sp. E2T0]
MALTDAVVRQAKPKQKSYTLKDFDGLYLFIAPNSTKSWHFRYQLKGKGVRISLGTYPELGLRDARILRDEARTLVAKGMDPRQHKKIVQTVDSDTQQVTFAVFAEHWKTFKLRKLATGYTGGRQSTLVQIERYMRKDLLPALGKLPLENITRVDILKVLRSIENRGALSIAEKCRGWLNELFRHAIVEGLINHNPAADMDIVALPQKPTQHNPYLKMDELPDFIKTLNNYQGALQTQLGIKLLLLTGVRTGELRQANKDQFDLQQGLWKIPAEQVKQLQKKVRTATNEIPPYIIPLPRQAITIVEQLISLSYPWQKYLLCHRSDPSQPISENTLNQGLRRMGYKDKLTGHGIRATLSTALNELGYPKEWIEAQLSHSDKDQIRATYNHAQYIEQRRNMMQEWADKLDQMIDQHVI